MDKKCKVTRKCNSKNVIAYRRKCAKTANGLSHYVMYGDAKKTLL